MENFIDEKGQNYEEEGELVGGRVEGKRQKEMNYN